MRLKQRHVDALACQHVGQDGSRRSGSHDSARRLLHITYLMGLDGILSMLRRADFLTHRSVLLVFNVMKATELLGWPGGQTQLPYLRAAVTKAPHFCELSVDEMANLDGIQRK